MAGSILCFNPFGQRRLKESFRGLFVLIPASLAFITSSFILSYISSTSELFIHHKHTHIHIKPPLKFSKVTPPTTPSTTPIINISLQQPIDNFPPVLLKVSEEPPLPSAINNSLQEPIGNPPPVLLKVSEAPPLASIGRVDPKSQWSKEELGGSQENNVNTNNKMLHARDPLESYEDVFHDRDILLKNYKEMNRSLKIYVYPHSQKDPFASVLLPVDKEPGGNYASESYFKKALMKSHFVTKNPSEADLFYLPFSIAGLRNHPRVGVGGIQDFIRDYIGSISHKYPYWNRTGGADHFYVACHSVGRSAMDKAPEAKANVIQMVCSSSYFLPGYIAHKDASIPQIWPRKGDPPNRAPSKRKTLAFFAGAMNSRVRQNLVQVWKNDTEIFVNQGRLKTPYDQAHLNSKFCIHAKGFEVNTARIGDALYYGCVPVILADHYDLPFADTLNWHSFSIVVSTSDIPLLKKILKEINFDEYLKLQSNVLKVRKHFQWHSVPVDYDAFYMAMYELWLRRSNVKTYV